MYLSVPHSIHPQSRNKEGSSPQALSGACAELTTTPGQGPSDGVCPCLLLSLSNSRTWYLCAGNPDPTSWLSRRGCAYRMTSDTEGPLPRIRVGAFNQRAIELTRNTQYMSHSFVAFLQLHTSQSEHLHGPTQTSQRQHGGD